MRFKVLVSQIEDKLRVASEKVSARELQHVVTEFIYHRELNGTRWISIEGATVKTNGFNVIEKKEKPEKEPPHQTAVQSGGL